jgi:hypothetical protein
MQIARLTLPFASLSRAVRVIDEESMAVVLHVEDANSVIGVASLKDDLHRGLGIWLEVSKDYPASLAARDVKTLSWLVELSDVVVSGSNASSNARVLEALLSDDEVSIVTDDAVITKAYNRPAPPRLIRVWHADGASLVSGEQVVTIIATRTSDAGELTYFA